jgi:hypothetical protein
MLLKLHDPFFINSLTAALDKGVYEVMDSEDYNQV